MARAKLKINKREMWCAHIEHFRRESKLLSLNAGAIFVEHGTPSHSGQKRGESRERRRERERAGESGREREREGERERGGRRFHGDDFRSALPAAAARIHNRPLSG